MQDVKTIGPWLDQESALLMKVPEMSGNAFSPNFSRENHLYVCILAIYNIYIYIMIIIYTVYIYRYIYIYIHTHTYYTYIHTYIQKKSLVPSSHLIGDSSWYFRNEDEELWEKSFRENTFLLNQALMDSPVNLCHEHCKKLMEKG